jgi:hypothetical protein
LLCTRGFADSSGRSLDRAVAFPSRSARDQKRLAIASLLSHWQPKVHARIEELGRERVAAARAASVPIDQVLTTLAQRGVDHVEDFFDRNAAGVLTPAGDDCDCEGQA